MDPLGTLAAEWERAKTGTLEYLDAMPEEHLGFRPAPEARSFAEQFAHLAAAQYMFGAGATGQASPLGADATDPEKDPGVTGSRDALRRVVAESYDFVLGGVRALDPGALGEEVEFFRMRMPRALILAKALEHHAHHRGQAAVYFRLVGRVPPSERLF